MEKFGFAALYAMRLSVMLLCWCPCLGKGGLEEKRARGRRAEDVRACLMFAASISPAFQTVYML